MAEDKTLYVAKFINHPLGPDRYVKDFRFGITENSSPWWTGATEKERVKHFEWALNHEQYHYSTSDINLADYFYCDDYDEFSRNILAQYAPVVFEEVVITLSDYPYFE